MQDTHRRLEDKVVELRSTQEQFAHAQRMEAVGRLAGGIAHDFNNILTVILGEADLALAAGAGEDGSKESLLEIRRSGERAAGLTRQLLAFSRRQLIEPTVFRLNDLVTDLEKMLVRLIGENIQLVTRADADAMAVRADRGQIEQVLMNLVVNARDAMPRGGRLVIETANVTLDDEYVRSRTEVTPGEYVMLTVSDTGSGMTDEAKAPRCGSTSPLPNGTRKPPLLRPRISSAALRQSSSWKMRWRCGRWPPGFSRGRDIGCWRRQMGRMP